MAVKRRKKLRHYNNPGDAHELTFSCHQRLPLLSRDRARLWLIEAIEKARRDLAFDVWAYVIMPEHAHVLVWPRQTIYDTSKILSAIKRPVAIKSIKYLREHSVTWLQRPCTHEMASSRTAFGCQAAAMTGMSSYRGPPMKWSSIYI